MRPNGRRAKLEGNSIDGKGGKEVSVQMDGELNDNKPRDRSVHLDGTINNDKFCERSSNTREQKEIRGFFLR